MITHKPATPKLLHHLLNPRKPTAETHLHKHPQQPLPSSHLTSKANHHQPSYPRPQLTNQHPIQPLLFFYPSSSKISSHLHRPKLLPQPIIAASHPSTAISFTKQKPHRQPPSAPLPSLTFTPLTSNQTQPSSHYFFLKEPKPKTATTRSHHFSNQPHLLTTFTALKASPLLNQQPRIVPAAAPRQQLQSAYEPWRPEQQPAKTESK